MLKRSRMTGGKEIDEELKPGYDLGSDGKKYEEWKRTMINHFAS